MVVRLMGLPDELTITTEDGVYHYELVGAEDNNG